MVQESGIIAQACYHPGEMPKLSGERARAYHEETKHSPLSIRHQPHFLDWDNQPKPFKIYRDVVAVPLPSIPGPGGDFPSASAGNLDVRVLSRLLFHTAGITKHLRLSGREIPFRAAACTGALYHVEIYVVTGPLDGLDAGVYHYDPRSHALDRLREGDFRGAVVESTGGEPSMVAGTTVLGFTTTYWRNAWKYRARAYRHAFWDSGTMLANLFAVGEALGLPLQLVLGFADEDVHRLLGVDSEKESAVALVAVGEGGGVPKTTVSPPLVFETEPLSREEVTYPAILEMQRASTLASGAAARDWREKGPSPQAPFAEEPVEGRRLEPLDLPSDLASVERVIRRRGSSRRFASESISFGALSTLVFAGTRGPSADCFPERGTFSSLYLIAHDVQELPSGAYVSRSPSSMIELLKPGAFRDPARFLDLEQELAGDASVNLYWLVDLEPLLERYGDRGYRVAQLEGGILGGRVYLAAYSLGLGASGLTFYDDAVTDFFSPHAKGRAVMFLVAAGVPARSRVVFQK